MIGIDFDIQTYLEFFIIVITEYSIDNTIKIISAWARTDNRDGYVCHHQSASARELIKAQPTRAPPIWPCSSIYNL